MGFNAPARDHDDWPRLAADIGEWGRALGFQEIGIADTELSEAEEHLQRWLAAGRHGDMDYMERHGTALRACRHTPISSALTVNSSRPPWNAR